MRKSELKKFQKKKLREITKARKVRFKRERSRLFSKIQRISNVEERQKEEEAKVFIQKSDCRPDLTDEQYQQLTRNIRILSSYEKDYDLTESERAKVHEELEAQGAITIKEKMDLLEKMTKEDQAKQKNLRKKIKGY